MERRTVLFVDDEEKVLRSLKRGLLDEPYKALFAESGKKALAAGFGFGYSPIAPGTLGAV